MIKKTQKKLRIIQLVDSSNPGGAERMAVNIANALVGEVEASFLCCTRKEGLLKQELNEEVGYFFARKMHSADLKAFLRLREFIKRERINLLQAHGTSWFWGVLLKVSGLNLKLVWQDHYGESERLEQRRVFLLKALARFFDGVIAVNSKLASWARESLKMERVIQLNNFVVATKESSPIKLKGNPGDFKIICVANLRPQKDHLNLLLTFELVCQEVDNVSLHLVGQDPKTEYSSSILERIKNSEVGERIFYYGSISGVTGLLEQADIGVLSSRSEGLPLALLEYGLVGLPVVCTKVGDCAKVIGDEGIIVAAGDSEALSLAILKFIRNDELRAFLGCQLKKRTIENYGESKYLKDLVAFYKML
ncbi:glycosyltransferase [Salegentibacter sp. HM20]